MLCFRISTTECLIIRNLSDTFINTNNVYANLRKNKIAYH